MKLTPNFDASEFDVHEPFPPQFAQKRGELAKRAQWLRDIAGSYGTITSAFRSADHNAEVGGVSTSQHMSGEAIDILFPLASLRAIATEVLRQVRAGLAPACGQIIFYADRGHIHISLPTLGARNGEVRYSFADATQRFYPFLTVTNVGDLPVLSGAQATVASKAAGGVAMIAALALGLAFLSGCSAALAQQAGTSQLDGGISLATAFSGVTMCLATVIAYLVREVRNDVRDMKEKVAILWDRHERETRGSLLQPFDVGRLTP